MTSARDDVRVIANIPTCDRPNNVQRKRRQHIVSIQELDPFGAGPLDGGGSANIFQ